MRLGRRPDVPEGPARRSIARGPATADVGEIIPGRFVVRTSEYRPEDREVIGPQHEGEECQRGSSTGPSGSDVGDVTRLEERAAPGERAHDSCGG